MNAMASSESEAFEAHVLADGLLAYHLKVKAFVSWQLVTSLQRKQTRALRRLNAIFDRHSLRRGLSVLKECNSLPGTGVSTTLVDPPSPIVRAVLHWRSARALAARLASAEAAVHAVRARNLQRHLLRTFSSVLSSLLTDRGHAYLSCLHYEAVLRRRGLQAWKQAVQQGAGQEAREAALQRAVRRWRARLVRHQRTPPLLLTAACHYRRTALSRVWSGWASWARGRKERRAAHLQAVTRLNDRRRRNAVTHWLVHALQARCLFTAHSRLHAAHKGRLLHRAWVGWIAFLRRKRISNAARRVAQTSLMKRVFVAWSEHAAGRVSARRSFHVRTHALGESRARRALRLWQAWSARRQHDTLTQQAAHSKWAVTAKRRTVLAWRLWAHTSSLQACAAVIGLSHWRRRGLTRAVHAWAAAAGARGRLRQTHDAMQQRMQSRAVRACLAHWSSLARCVAQEAGDERARALVVRQALNKGKLGRVLGAWKEYHAGHMRRAVQSALARHNARIALMRSAWEALRAYVCVRHEKRAQRERADRVCAVRVVYMAWCQWRGAVQAVRAEEDACDAARAWYASRLCTRVLWGWRGYTQHRQALARGLRMAVEGGQGGASMAMLRSPRITWSSFLPSHSSLPELGAHGPGDVLLAGAAGRQQEGEQDPYAPALQALAVAQAAFEDKKRATLLASPAGSSPVRPATAPSVVAVVEESGRSGDALRAQPSMDAVHGTRRARPAPRTLDSSQTRHTPSLSSQQPEPLHAHAHDTPVRPAAAPAYPLPHAPGQVPPEPTDGQGQGLAQSTLGVQEKLQVPPAAVDQPPAGLGAVVLAAQQRVQQAEAAVAVWQRRYDLLQSLLASSSQAREEGDDAEDEAAVEALQASLMSVALQLGHGRQALGHAVAALHGVRD